MSQMKPVRCPFLLGEPWGNSFNARQKGEVIKVNFKCSQCGALFNTQFDQLPKENGCLDGNYTRCQLYSSGLLKLSSQIPSLCPAYDEEKQECTADQSKCNHYWIDLKVCVDDAGCQDYRDCAVFSKWFWEQITNNPGDPHHNECGDDNH